MNKIRFVTATSLFDGHDVSINIMRRILQSKGIEVIHLGHNRSAQEVVDAALSEDVQAIALSSYQGGHVEYFSYIRELLDKNNGSQIKIFGGGGGVITPKEVKFLENKGITKIYTPEDGMNLGLEGIVEDMIKKSDYSTIENYDFLSLNYSKLKVNELSKIITHIEDLGKCPIKYTSKDIPTIGVTGTGGAGKSSLIDELLLRIHQNFSQKKVALISVDPTKKRTQGALLGDRIRLASATYDQFFIRSLATRNSTTELSPQIAEVISFLKSQQFDLIIIETSGIGQAADAITQIADKCMYVMTGEFGAQSQLEKIEMLDSADYIVINKFEKIRSEDAYRDVCKQYKRNHKLFEKENIELPIFGTMAARFNDNGLTALYKSICHDLKWINLNDSKNSLSKTSKNKFSIIPPEQSLYLREISKINRDYTLKTNIICQRIEEIEALEKSITIIGHNDILNKKLNDFKETITNDVWEEIKNYHQTVKQLQSGQYSYFVRNKEINVNTKYTSLSQNKISKVAFPKNLTNSQIYKFIRNENLPGFFPYASGIFPFKRKDEDPKRMFAGEGGPLRTNRRFHFLSKDDVAKRLSTAFDSATLYGEDPAKRPDIFGKIGEAGVSIASLQDMNDLFQDFDLCSNKTSVSMTINGPAPIILAMFMNTAIQQNLSEKNKWDQEKRLEIIKNVRGTVQADILKEDQAQNTCIFSLDFALRLMGDVQEYFCKNSIKNYYTVSISGYHIAEAGANPITQLAFTLSNGFTYVEYYLSRGMKIDDFAENLSFFFSNGLDPEYSVLGRVARKIWAITMKEKYGANIKSQKFKYHIQTSGRSLHAQEIDFNDIRTTLQAFLALSDNCNSLHTNAYDEAITTPTEESVRRAMAIQMIINREFGLNKTDNPMQGSYLLNELSQIVEEAVLKEFENISDKGGVLGAMESMYQRGQIQDESHYYESLKDSGEFPIIGVNTYINPNVSEQLNQEIELSRCSDQEKMEQIKRLQSFKDKNKLKSAEALTRLTNVALKEENIFEELLYTVNYCTLGEITNTLFKVGGSYRRNM